MQLVLSSGLINIYNISSFVVQVSVGLLKTVIAIDHYCNLYYGASVLPISDLRHSFHFVSKHLSINNLWYH